MDQRVQRRIGMGRAVTAIGAALVALGGGGALGGGSTASAATTCIDYEDGFVDDAGLLVNDDATVLPDGVLRLTTTETFQVGSAFGAEALDVSSDLGFDATFRFRITEPDGITDASGFTGADGLAFLFVNTATAPTGGTGVGIGYEGIDNSLAIELDTFHNGGIDPDHNHLGVQPDGLIDQAQSLATVPAAQLPDFSDGAVHTVRIRYVPPSLPAGIGLEVSVDGALEVDLPAFDLEDHVSLGGNSFVGFTSATGSAWENHDVLGFIACSTDGTVPTSSSSTSSTSSTSSSSTSSTAPTSTSTTAAAASTSSTVARGGVLGATSSTTPRGLLPRMGAEADELAPMALAGGAALLLGGQLLVHATRVEARLRRR